MAILESLCFRRLTPEDREPLEALRRASDCAVYLYTFATLFAWQDTEDYTVAFSRDAFLVKNSARGEHAYLFPCGTEAGRLAMLNVLMQEHDVQLYFLTDADKAFLEEHFPGRFTFEECRDDFTYQYDRQSQVAMAGKPYRHLRHDVNNARNAFRWDVRAMTEDNVDAALRINRLWMESHDGTAGDVDAANTALSQFSLLGLWGLLFQADGKDVAYVAGSFVREDLFDVSFCKVLLPGADCYIKWEMYCRLPDGVTTVDSEEDMGIPGLRQHKLMRKPTKLTTIWKGTFRHE